MKTNAKKYLFAIATLAMMATFASPQANAGWWPPSSWGKGDGDSTLPPETPIKETPKEASKIRTALEQYCTRIETGSSS